MLACLTEKPMHPYEISTTLRTRGKEKSIKLNYGSLYAVVESLQKHGLISAREITRDGRRPERTVYEITGAGVEEFEDWLAELLSTPVRDFTSLEAGLSLMPGPATGRGRAVARGIGSGQARRRAACSWTPRLAEGGGHAAAGAVRRGEPHTAGSCSQAELAFVTEAGRGDPHPPFPGTKTWRKLHELVAGGTSFEEIMADPVSHLGEEGQVLSTAMSTAMRRPQ